MNNLDWAKLYRDGLKPWEDGQPWRPLVPSFSIVTEAGLGLIRGRRNERIP